MATATPPSVATDPTQPLPNIKHEAFAHMVASGVPAYKSYTAVGFKAKTDGVAASCGSLLLNEPSVYARVSLLRKGYDQQFATEISRKVVGNITDRVERIKGYALRRQLLLELMAERAQDPANQDIPGIRTGTLVVSMKLDKRGKVVSREVRTDTAMLKHILDIERQAAIELRQWVEQNTEIPWDFDPKSLTPDQLDKLLAGFSRMDPTGYATIAQALELPAAVGDVIDTKADKTKVDPLA